MFYVFSTNLGHGYPNFIAIKVKSFLCFYLSQFLTINKLKFKELMDEENGFYDKLNDKCKIEIQFSII